MTGAEAVIKALVENDVEVIFGYPGGAVLPLYDAIFDNKKIRHILVRHEQAAVHAAEGYARSTGKVGCVLVTSGPGATNAITGLTDALMDSIPIICLSGQVPTHLIGTDAFQEADTTGISRPCTKHNYLVKDADLLCDTIHESFEIASTGRPGPVLVDLPKDIQLTKIKYEQKSVKIKKNVATNLPKIDTKIINKVVAKTGREIPKDIEKKEHKKITYKENTFVMFLNTNKSVHGVTPRENALHDRLSINIIAEAEKKLGPLFKLNEIVQ